MNIIYNILYGLIIVTGIVIIFLIPITFIIDKILSGSIFDSSVSGYIILGIFICLISIGFFLNKDKDNRPEEERAREINPFIKK